MNQGLWLPDLHCAMESVVYEVQGKRQIVPEPRGEVKGGRKRKDMFIKHRPCARPCAQHCPI